MAFPMTLMKKLAQANRVALNGLGHGASILEFEGQPLGIGAHLHGLIDLGNDSTGLAGRTVSRQLAGLDL
jgi:hypothetical protein